MNYPQLQNYQPMYQPMYNPMYYYPNMIQSYPQQMQSQQTGIEQQSPQSTQVSQVSQPIMRESNDYIPVQNREIARNYPVAPGNTVNFRDENAPYIYRKTMGSSQFDAPKFEVIKLVKEEEIDTENIKSEKNEQSIEPDNMQNVKNTQAPIDITVLNDINNSISVLNTEIKNELNEVRQDIDGLKNSIEDLNRRRPKPSKKVGESYADE